MTLILIKYFEGSISDKEKEELMAWLTAAPENKELFKKEAKEWYSGQEHCKVDSEIAYYTFMNTIEKKKIFGVPLQSFHRLSRYAAVFIAFAIGTYFYSKKENSINTSGTTEMIVSDAVENKIKITQEDGTITFLGTADEAMIVDANGNSIGKKDQHGLKVKSNKKLASLVYMEVAIPRGELFKLTLSDGTKVWLNSDSKLKFPQHFISSEKNRVVFLEGEAFFDVETNKEQPFIVKTNALDVQVLGTQFNVSSYAEDATIKTTLVEGKVAINSQDKSRDPLILTPSYQGVYSKGKNLLNKKKVNTARYTSWRDKKIVLENESFEEVYKRIERSYDVLIINNNDTLNQTRFTGEFDVENIEEILTTFSETLGFTYEIKNNKITINP